MVRTAAIGAMLLLSSCDRVTAPQNDHICTNPPPLYAQATTVAGQREAVDGCLHRWGFRLSKGSASDRDAADAVVAACEDAIERAVDLVQQESGETASRRQAWNRYATRKALFHVVQSRAGQCRVDNEKVEMEPPPSERPPKITPTAPRK